MFGCGLALAAARWQRIRDAGEVLAAYGAFALAAVAALSVVTTGYVRFDEAATQPAWAIVCGVVGLILAVAAVVLMRRAGTAFAAAAIALVLAVDALAAFPQTASPWLIYAFELCAMLGLVVSGMLDAVRARMIAGWLGIAGVIGGITWAVKGALLHRSLFLAAAGAVAIALATLLNRLLPRIEARTEP
jgi:hypothetical protein